MEPIGMCIVCHKSPISYKKKKLCTRCNRKQRDANAPQCVYCKKRPVQIKKRGLCIPCYQKQQRLEAFVEIGKEVNDFKCQPTLLKHENLNEVYFIKNYFNHKNWIYNPAMFHMGDAKYSPDFYDGETGAFIEVVGTRQAYHLNKAKYELFRKTYPSIKFEIRHKDGSLLDETTDRLVWVDATAQYELALVQ